MKILQWVLAVALAFVMAGAGLNKIFSSEFRDLLGDQINTPNWFLVLVGLFELLLAVDLLLPRFRILGGVGVAVTMVAAAVFNLFGDTVDGNNPRVAIPLNLVLAVLALVTAWLAAGRPRSVGTLLTTARQQLRGQAAAVAETATDAIT